LLDATRLETAMLRIDAALSARDTSLCFRRTERPVFGVTYCAWIIPIDAATGFPLTNSRLEAHEAPGARGAEVVSFAVSGLRS
jgi:hypothetical protein